MNESLFSLEEWTAKVSAAAKSNTRTLMAHFQRHWYEGHLQNPLLFPMTQSHQAWKAHLDWFLTVEKFKLPDQKPEKEKEPVKNRSGLMAPPPSESAETVFFNVDNFDRSGKTVIYEPPKTAVPDDHEWDELSDLGTLIVESRKETGAEINDDAPQARTEKPVSSGPRPQKGHSAPRETPDADKTVMIDQTGGQGIIKKQAEESRADQTILIDRPYSLERETPQTETVIYAPEQAGGQAAFSSDQGTMISEYDPSTPDDGQETVVMEAQTVVSDLKKAARKAATETADHPFPKNVEGLRVDVEKDADEEPSSDMDLDLGDLDTMTWFDDEGKPEK